MPILLVARTETKAAKYVLIRVLEKIQVLSVVTPRRLVECAAMKKKGERYSEISLTIYQSLRRNISKDLKSIALRIQGNYFI